MKLKEDNGIHSHSRVLAIEKENPAIYDNESENVILNKISPEKMDRKHMFSFVNKNLQNLN